ncbi:MAG: FAD-dependent oxidoreductase [Alphaproteobacteria bacterium]|nr:FAD-dependent oxidoreductase [Alphaproteobacteria bacterium]
MARALIRTNYDVVVVGGGAAGVAAAIAAARNGAKTVLIDAGPLLGGEMLSGIPIDGCLSSRGEWVVGGVIREIFDECDRLGGYIGPINDYRSLNVIATDPEIMKIAISNRLRAAGVVPLMYSFAEDVVVDKGRVTGVVVLNKQGRLLVEGKIVIDCSGDGDVAVAAGAPFEIGDAAKGDLQPVTLVFRMVGVETKPLLQFVVDHPENFGLGEYSGLPRSAKECALGLQRQGLPKVFLVSDGPLMRKAIEAGDLYRSSMIAVTPVSLARKEVSLNTTRIGNIDATNTADLSRAFGDLTEQVWNCAAFMRKYVPGFENAHFSGLAPRIGIRETRRVMCDYVLSDDDVREARKKPDGIAKGCHELDIHGSGTGHFRSEILDGGSYDVPYGTLIARNLDNVMVAGRCMSATRLAHSTARVMGTCMAMGQAAGTAAALCVTSNAPDALPRDVDINRLRGVLRAQGAVLEGTR